MIIPIKNIARSKYLKLSTLVLFFITCTTLAQRTEAVLTFNDGTVKTGYAKLKGKGIVKFKASKKEKPVKYHFSNIEKAVIEGKTYLYVNVEGEETPVVLERVLAGKVSLYRKSTQGHMPYPGGEGTGFGGTPGFGFAGGYSYDIKNFYVHKENETHVTYLGSNQLFTKNFKKAASDYFENCPTLVKKIQDGTLKKKDLRDIVLFFNDQCN